MGGRTETCARTYQSTPIGTFVKVIVSPADRLREQTKFRAIEGSSPPTIAPPKMAHDEAIEAPRRKASSPRPSPTERICADMQQRPEATREEMRDAKLPLAYRDSCANLLIPLNRCRFETYYLPWKCEVGPHPTAVTVAAPGGRGPMAPNPGWTGQAPHARGSMGRR